MQDYLHREACNYIKNLEVIEIVSCEKLRVEIFDIREDGSRVFEN